MKKSLRICRLISETKVIGFKKKILLKLIIRELLDASNLTFRESEWERWFGIKYREQIAGFFNNRKEYEYLLSAQQEFEYFFELFTNRKTLTTFKLIPNFISDFIVSLGSLWNMGHLTNSE
jgi:hypothetical protein